MKKKFASSIALLFLFIKVTAQNNLPPVYAITNDTALYQVLPNEYWQMLEDKESKLSFEQVSKSTDENKFHYDNTKDSQFDYAIHAYWFRYVLKNMMNHTAKIYFGDLSGF